MAFHKSNLGGFGEKLPCDHMGYVPEADDTPSQFDFGGEDIDDDWFDEFKANAVTRTAEASNRLQEWRNS